MKTETKSSRTEATAGVPSHYLLEALPVAAESMQDGQYYIWNKGDGRISVVMICPNREEMEEQDNDRDHWWFEDALIGTLHGPISFSSNVKAQGMQGRSP